MADQHFEDAKLPRGHIKHKLLKSYLDAWFPIILHTYGKAVYVDGFAGAGKHGDQADGSPLVVLKAIKEHKVDVKRFEDPTVILIFIEKDANKCSHLEENLATADRAIVQQNKLTIKREIIQGDFNTAIIRLLPDLKDLPMFIFPDPFGYNCKMETCRSILETHSESAPKELFINLMDGNIRRFERNPEVQQSLNELIGCDDWHERYEAAPEIDAKLRVFYEIYVENLQKGYAQSEACYQNKIKALRFGMRRSNSNTHVYHLVFATTHYKGLDRMRAAMSKHSQCHDKYVFSEFVADKGFMRDVELEKIFKVKDVVKLVRNHFKGKEVTGDEIEKFILDDTPYQPNIKRELKKELANFAQGKTCKFSDMKFLFSENMQTESGFGQESSSPISKEPFSLQEALLNISWNRTVFTHSMKDTLSKCTQSIHEAEGHSDTCTPTKDFVIKIAVKRILHVFSERNDVVGQDIHEWVCKNVSSTLVSKSKLKDSLKKYRAASNSKTREFFKMKFNFPTAPTSSHSTGVSSSGAEAEEEGALKVKRTRDS